MKKRILLTGATGFVGSRVAGKLVSEGYDVHIIVRPDSSLSQIVQLSDQVTIHVHDGSTEGMLAVMEAAQPAVVFHIASMVQSEHKPEDIVPLIQANIVFASQLVEAMLKSGCHQLINTGTFWQHYENKDYSPVCLYAATKQAFEAILQYYIEARAIKVITLILFDNYGPNDPRPKLFHLLEKVSKSQEQLSMSPGEQLMDLVYIDDVVNAYIIAAERMLSGKVWQHERYSISSGNPISLKEVVSTYEHALQTKLPIQWGGRPYRDREVMAPWNAGMSLPGWKPLISLSEGILAINSLGYLHD